MKIIYLQILAFLPFSILAQLPDTTLNCLANWQKGEKKELVITRNKERIEKGKQSQPFNFTYLAHISILDSTDEGYSVQWVLDIPEEVKKASPGIEKLMPVYNGLKIIFTTNNVGSFKSLINWEEVRDVYFNMMSNSAPEEGDSIRKASMDKARAMFNSQQLVEGSLIKEVQLYYAPYGGEFTTKEITSSTSLPNPFGGEPMPAISMQKIKKINPEKKSFTAKFTQNLDSTGIRILMSSMFQAMHISIDKIDSVNKYTEDMLSKFQIEDDSEYNITIPTGWITTLKYKRTGITGEIKQTETYSFHMR
ncbi:MAG: hypothetical protein HZB42_13625 [Sphingobacteriales bacterium]|nr:hypothetical protein [Sphingobacteriales bacterium]